MNRLKSDLLADRQTDRQTDRHRPTDRQTNRQTDRQITKVLTYTFSFVGLNVLPINEELHLELAERGEKAVAIQFVKMQC